MKPFRKLILAGVTAFVMAMAPIAAHALNIQLGFVLDRSGSIGAGNWGIITQGLSDAIDLIPVGGPDTYEVSIVTFATGATTNFSNVVLDSIAVRNNLSNLTATMPYSGGWTNYAAAFGAMTTVLGNSSNVDASFVNFATDGNPTRGGGGRNGNFPRHNNAGIAAQMAMTAAGIDNISIEAIGNNLDATNLQNNYCYPGPCQTTFPPSGFPGQGFYIAVPDAQGYANAIKNKVRVVTGQNPVPEPGTIILFGTGLAGLAAWRMRKAKQA